MNKQIHIGDLVSILDDDIKGKVIKITDTAIEIEDTDGFERSCQIDELVIYDLKLAVDKTAINEESNTINVKKTSKESTINIGDTVSTIQDTIKGKVVKIQGNNIIIEDTDGFERSIKANELVVYDKKLEVDKTTPKIVFSDKEQKSGVYMDYKKTSEIDLHNTNFFLSKNRILENQLSEFKNELNYAIERGQTHITFIHGKGAGVLKSAIQKILNKNKIKHKKAPHKIYGQGAIEVYLVDVDWVIK